MRYLLFLVSTLGLLHMSITPAFAAVDNDPVARVAALRHQVTAINSSGKERSLRVSSEIYKGDTIQTGKKGRLQILFPDNTIVSLGRDTTFVINDYLWQPDKQDGEFRSEVKEGIFRVMGGKLTKTVPKNFTTKTPAATIGIRGSIYAGVVTDDLLSIVFLGGRGIFVRNEFGSVEIPKPGYGTIVRAGAPPPPPTIFSGDDLAPFTSGLTGPGDDEGVTIPPPGSPGEDLGEGSPQLPSPNEYDPPLPTLPPQDDITPPPSTFLPTDGITLFPGEIWGFSQYYAEDSQESVEEIVSIFANWHNRKVLGVVHDPSIESGIPVFFFGDIDGTSVNNVKVYGNDYNEPIDPYYSLSDQISLVEGSGNGNFYLMDLTTLLDTNSTSIYEVKSSSLATEVIAFDMEGNGYYYDPGSQLETGSWEVEGAGLGFYGDITAPRGIEVWEGYAVGISEDVNNVDSNRHLLTSNVGDFYLDINKDTGNISGSLSATNGYGFSLSNVTVGDSYGSAFIDDDIFVTILGGGSKVVDSYESLGPLNSRGNFLTTGNTTLMGYASWGYWQTAYIDPDTGHEYLNRPPRAMWVAGQPTSITDIAALASNKVVGEYTGDVIANKIDTSSVQVSQLTGEIYINVDFSMLGDTSASAITGNMSLDDNLFTIDSQGVAGSPHFSSTLNGGAFTGNLNGTMYGPNAGSIGGNFTTNNGEGGITYQGIYGADRVPVD